MTRAAGVCSTPGCPNLRPCDTHTPKPWANADQRRPNALRGTALQHRNAAILKAHHGICHACGKSGATQVDHIIAYANGGTDDDSNLAPIHSGECHDAKTRSEAAAGRNHGG